MVYETLVGYLMPNSYWKESLLVALDYSPNFTTLYIYIYILVDPREVHCFYLFVWSCLMIIFGHFIHDVQGSLIWDDEMFDIFSRFFQWLVEYDFLWISGRIQSWQRAFRMCLLFHCLVCSSILNLSCGFFQGLSILGTHNSTNFRCIDTGLTWGLVT